MVDTNICCGRQKLGNHNNCGIISRPCWYFIHKNVLTLSSACQHIIVRLNVNYTLTLSDILLISNRYYSDKVNSFVLYSLSVFPSGFGINSSITIPDSWVMLILYYILLLWHQLCLHYVAILAGWLFWVICFHFEIIQKIEEHKLIHSVRKIVKSQRKHLCKERQCGMLETGFKCVCVNCLRF